MSRAATPEPAELPDLYDAGPIEPRTTAAQWAADLAECYGHGGMPRQLWTSSAPWSWYRDAADYEGELYAEALRGSRAMRQRAHSARSGDLYCAHSLPRDRTAAWEHERIDGLPCNQLDPLWSRAR